ncbi:Opioid-binding protein/cell adhesion molecule-like [Gryllus bimaculatus]|nr:Opioid-binding protein/cell adhesion molecule-like [Gryllus bimaculatus]
MDQYDGVEQSRLQQRRAEQIKVVKGHAAVRKAGRSDGGVETAGGIGKEEWAGRVVDVERGPLGFEPDFLYPLENVTIAQGRDAMFTCVVNNLGGYRLMPFGVHIDISLLV